MAATAAAAVVSTDGKRSLPKGAHVRFSHVESVDHTNTGGATNAQAANAGEKYIHLSSICIPYNKDGQ